MVLCDILPWESGAKDASFNSSVALFVATWSAMTITGLALILLMSGTVFYLYYWEPKYETWLRKSNADFPSALKVREEVITMCKGMATATFCPALSIVLAHNGISKAYCGFPEPHNSLSEQFVTFMGVWAFSDWFEWFYHYCGHSSDFLWHHHRHHHKFFNPTPFSVIADEYIDQFVRASPLLFMPLIFPLNIDMLFVQYAIFFYGYGTYLHWGYEVAEGNPIIDPHSSWLNTATQHYLHHAKSVNKKPYHTGFMFKLWDDMVGAKWGGKCSCPKHTRERGERSPEIFEKIMAEHDYKPLLNPMFWITGQVKSKLV